jgi:hypothetical protein
VCLTVKKCKLNVLGDKLLRHIYFDEDTEKFCQISIFRLCVVKMMDQKYFNAFIYLQKLVTLLTKTLSV